MNLPALTAYFESWANPVAKEQLPIFDVVLPDAMQPLQYRWLGLGAEIAIQGYIISHLESPDLDSQKKLADLKRKQAALALSLKIKKLEIPDPERWRHPELPAGLKEETERLFREFPRENRAEMASNRKGQTGEGTGRKPRKGKKISPKPVRIKG